MPWPPEDDKMQPPANYDPANPPWLQRLFQAFSNPVERLGASNTYCLVKPAMVSRRNNLGTVQPTSRRPIIWRWGLDLLVKPARCPPTPQQRGLAKSMRVPRALAKTCQVTWIGLLFVERSLATIRKV